MIRKRKLKKRLSAVLRAADRGQTFTVTTRGGPVARIVPAGEDVETMFDVEHSMLRDMLSQPRDGQPTEHSASTSGRAVLAVLRSVQFFSQTDEDAFFYWLDRLPCVDGYRGQGIDLVISLKDDCIDDAAVAELRGLLRRYRIQQSDQALTPPQDIWPWLSDPRGYWCVVETGT